MHKKERWWGGGPKKTSTSSRRGSKYAYNKKGELRLKVNTAILEHFFFSGLRKLNNLGPWKQSNHCSK